MIVVDDHPLNISAGFTPWTANLTIGKGTIIRLDRAPNGAGKTTLFNVIRRAQAHVGPCKPGTARVITRPAPANYAVSQGVACGPSESPIEFHP